MKSIPTRILASLMLFATFTAGAQTITTSGINGGPFCAGSYVSVPFSITGTFNNGNVFTAQLSDASGNWGTPVAIGTTIATAGGNIHGAIPVSTPAGTGYRIRVVSSGPATTGTVNNTDLTVVRATDDYFQKSYVTTGNAATTPGKAIQLADSSIVFTTYGANLYKADVYGNPVWTKRLNETHNSGSFPLGFSDYTKDLRQTADGGFIIAGHKIYNNGAGINLTHIWLIKTDSLGNVQWSKLYGDSNMGGCSGGVGNFVSTVKQTFDGGYIMSGYTNGFGFGCAGKDIFIKVDATGNHLWTKTIDDFCVNFVYGWGAGDVVEIPGGGGDLMFYASNYPYPCLTGFAVLIRTKADGTLVWSKKLSGFSFNVLSTRIVATTGGYYLGSTNGFAVIKVDLNGDVLWSRTFGGEYGSDVYATADAGCIMTGYAYTGNPQNARVIKVSANGALEWAEDYGSGGNVQGQSIVQALDGGYIMAGNIDNTLYLVKTDNLGNSGGNQSTPSLSATSGGGSSAAFMPVFTSRTPNVYDGCIASSNTVTTVTTIVGTGDCALGGLPFNSSSCDSLLLSISSQNNPTCHNDTNGTATIAVSGGTSPYTYAWSNGQTSATASGLGQGSYAVTVTDKNGVVATKLVDITQPAPVSLTVSADTSICPGGNALLTVSGAGNYRWYPTEGLSDTTAASILASPLTTTAYTVTGQVGGCTGSAAIMVSMASLPLTTLTVQDSLICAGDSAQVCATGAYSFLWNTGETTACIYAKVAGGYWVTATETGACSTESGCRQVSVYPVSSVSIVVQGDTLVSFGAVTYQWYRGNTAIPGATGTQYIARQADYYAVEITDSNGCVNKSTPVFAGPTGIGTYGNYSQLSVYPNPANDYLLVKYSDAGAIGELHIYNSTGQVVFAGGIEKEQVINTSLFSPGIYLLVVKSAEGYSTRKIVIGHK